ncbi:hypothetical protein [Streptomyces avicenniae]|uniref:hypothetical protein n=1 Tax=Streptomyces avicenniae TaxID=500153 RepID=UPI00069A0BFF|nr:hypothetical protein [Streptomyces avicenniae]
MADDRYRPPEPAPRRDPNPHITVITGLEGPLWRPVLSPHSRQQPDPATEPAQDGTHDEEDPT